MFIIRQVFNEEVRNDWNDYDIEGEYRRDTCEDFDRVISFLRDEIDLWVEIWSENRYDLQIYNPTITSLLEGEVLPTYFISYIDEETQQFFKMKGLSLEDYNGVFLGKYELYQTTFNKDNIYTSETLKEDIFNSILEECQVGSLKGMLSQLDKLQLMRDIGLTK